MSKLDESIAANLAATADCFEPRCPAREVLDHVFSRWGSLVLGALYTGRRRYSQLRFEVGGISEKMLAQTLRTLERDGLVLRESLPVVPPHVDYELTPLGRECARRVDDLVDWIQDSVGDVVASQDRFDERRAAHRAS